MKIRSINTSLLAALLALSVSNVFASVPGTPRTPRVTASTLAPDSWVDSTLNSMTLDEKIGQLIVPAVIGMFLSKDSDTFKQMARDVTEFHVGGYHMLGEG